MLQFLGAEFLHRLPQLRPSAHPGAQADRCNARRSLPPPPPCRPSPPSPPAPRSPRPRANPATCQSGSMTVGRTRRSAIRSLKVRRCSLFLRLHMPQQVAFAAASQHRELPGVNARRAIFAGMIHPDHPLDAVPCSGCRLEALVRHRRCPPVAEGHGQRARQMPGRTAGSSPPTTAARRDQECRLVAGLGRARRHRGQAVGDRAAAEMRCGAFGQRAWPPAPSPRRHAPRRSPASASRQSDHQHQRERTSLAGAMAASKPRTMMIR